MQAIKNYLWNSASFKELGYPFWWDNQIVWFYQKYEWDLCL
jgi:hypothetical protein